MNWLRYLTLIYIFSITASYIYFFCLAYFDPGKAATMYVNQAGEADLEFFGIIVPAVVLVPLFIISEMLRMFKKEFEVI